MLADVIPGIRVVKAFAQESARRPASREANYHNLALNDRINKTWSLFGPTVTPAHRNRPAGGVGLRHLAESTGEITVGVPHRLPAYISCFYTRLDSSEPHRFGDAKAAAGASASSTSSTTSPACRSRPIRSISSPCESEIEFRSCGFRYGTRAVIWDVSLTIHPGEMIGLVGHPGSGKSTW